MIHTHTITSPTVQHVTRAQSVMACISSTDTSYRSARFGVSSRSRKTTHVTATQTCPGLVSGSGFWPMEVASVSEVMRTW